MRPIRVTPAYIYREHGYRDGVKGRDKKLGLAREAGEAGEYRRGYQRGAEARMEINAA